jgi:catechol 2,3-dioxygenase-like lactoylglutathione lyase family enzyme/predicted enzyme related to lactoylglutathione lyase
MFEECAVPTSFKNNFVTRRHLVRKAALVFGTTLIAVAMQTAQTPAGAVTGACHVSPIVSDLDKSAHFYHDILGLDLVPAPGSGRLPWDTDPGHLNLHGLPQARLRFIGARMPGVDCGVELVEFAGVEQRSVRRRLEDPGATMLILLVRDLDAIFSRLKAARATVLTKGGEPMFVGPSKTARAVIVQDPDGHPIELAQLQPTPQTTASAQSNVIGIRLRITVTDSEKAAIFYRQALGIVMEPGVFTKDESVMAMMGFPAAAQYRVATSTLPGSSLVLELDRIQGSRRNEVAAVASTGSRLLSPTAECSRYRRNAHRSEAVGRARPFYGRFGGPDDVRFKPMASCRSSGSKQSFSCRSATSGAIARM